MDIMIHAKFHFNGLMLTLIFGIRASEPPPRAWRTTEKAGPDRVKGAVGSADLKISKSALLSLNHHNFSNTKPIYTE